MNQLPSSITSRLASFFTLLCLFTSTAFAQFGEQLRNIGDAYNMDVGFTAPYTERQRQISTLQSDVGTINLNPTDWTAPNFNQPNGGANFGLAIQERNWFAANGKKMTLHLLVGKQMGPDWFVDPNNNGFPGRYSWSPNELRAMMATWISNVAAQFGPYVDSVVVVNEATWETQWNNLPGTAAAQWLNMGWDNGTPSYIIEAYRLARQYFPSNVKLVYNDYNHEGLGAKPDRVFDIFNRLSWYGLTPDVVGFQCHFTIDQNYQMTYYPQNIGEPANVVNLNNWRTNIRRFWTSFGAETHITELDIGLPINTPGVWTYQQAKFMSQIGALATSEPTLTSVTLWKHTDNGDPQWRQGERAALFDQNGNTKDAFYGLQLGLMGLELDRAYRLGNGWTGNYVLTGSPNPGTPIVTHTSNPSWGYGKWYVRLGPDGTIRLECVGAPGRYMAGSFDLYNSVRLQNLNWGGSQDWRPMRSRATWGRITLTNQSTNDELNATGQFDNAWLITYPKNDLPRQDFEFLLDF